MKKYVKNKGQAAVEYLVTLGIVTAIVLTQFSGLMQRSYDAASKYFAFYAEAIANQKKVSK